jgi:hypothetical protein
MMIVDAIVKKTSSQLADSGRILQEILAAAANEKGEWEVPLPKEKIEAMREAMNARSEHLDEVSSALSVEQYPHCLHLDSAMFLTLLLKPKAGNPSASQTAHVRHVHHVTSVIDDPDILRCSADLEQILRSDMCCCMERGAAGWVV